MTCIFHMSICCDKSFKWVPTGSFVCLFYSPEQFFSYLAAVNITGDRAANLNLCLALMALSSKGSFSCHTFCDTGPRFVRYHRGTGTPRPSGIRSGDARIIRSLRLRSNHCVTRAAPTGLTVTLAVMFDRLTENFNLG
jgi:hypothetical protein